MSTETPTQLTRLEGAALALAECRTLAEVADIHDVFLAFKMYAKAKKHGEDAIRFAGEMVLRAERRMGQLLAETPKQSGPGRGKTHTDRPDVLPELSPRREVGYPVSSRAQRIAAVPEETFERFLASEHELNARNLFRVTGTVNEAPAPPGTATAEPKPASPPRGTTVVYEATPAEFLETITDESVEALITRTPPLNDMVEIDAFVAVLRAALHKVKAGRHGILMIGAPGLPDWNLIARVLVEQSTNLGDTLLDPFARDGVVVEVAASLGRIATGAESNPRMLNACRDRGLDVVEKKATASVANDGEPVQAVLEL